MIPKTPICQFDKKVVLRLGERDYVIEKQTILYLCDMHTLYLCGMHTCISRQVFQQTRSLCKTTSLYFDIILHSALVFSA